MRVGSWRRTGTPSETTSCSCLKTAGRRHAKHTPVYDSVHISVLQSHALSCVCRLDFIYDLFERVGSRNGDETLKMGTARRKPTVSSQFRVGANL